MLVQRNRFSVICIFLVVPFFTSVFFGQEAEQAYTATTTSYPQIPVGDLELLLKPLTKSELVVETEAWLQLLKSKVKEISTVEIQMRQKSREIDEKEEEIDEKIEKIEEQVETGAATSAESTEQLEEKVEAVAEAKEAIEEKVEAIDQAESEAKDIAADSQTKLESKPEEELSSSEEDLKKKTEEVVEAQEKAKETVDPFLGRWALTIPDGGAGWLNVVQEDGYLDATILWGGGSVVPVASVYMDEDTLNVTRVDKVERKDAQDEVVRTHTFTETIIAKVSGDTLRLTQVRPHSNGKGISRSEFTGKRILPLPPKPDLANAEYGKPIVLFNGTSLDGWKLTNPSQTNGWSVEDGVLVNRPVQQKGKPHVPYGNLRTVAEFKDFNLKLEVNVPKKGNSGVYLRGIYEVQVSDSFGRKLDSHNMGAIYSRITPTTNAEKQAGQWQQFDITLLDRHVTVKLNGTTIIDNQPLLGCTGGALWSDEFKPGPIYLQGDHSAISYRNIILTPIIKTKAGRSVVLFEDRFDGKLAPGWAWLRENPSAWRLRQGALEIGVEPGVAHTVKNALVRQAPDRSRGKFVVDITITNTTKPTQQYEQAGITWYHDGKPVFKLVKELVDGELVIIPGRKPMPSETVQLRLVVTSDSFVAQFRPDAKGEFKAAATGALPAPGDDQVSIQCYNGPPNAEHWIRFDDFRILELYE